MKWTFNVVKTIVTPIEIEAEDFADAIKKAYAQIPDVDTDHGRGCQGTGHWHNYADDLSLWHFRLPHDCRYSQSEYWCQGISASSLHDMCQMFILCNLFVGNIHHATQFFEFSGHLSFALRFLH